MLFESPNCLSWGGQTQKDGSRPPVPSDWSLREVSAVTEIPEHLLNRSKARRAGASGEASSTENAPAVAASSAPVAKAPAQAAAPKPPKQDPPYVKAAKERHKIPFWAMSGLAMLPVWAFIYFLALSPQEKKVEGPLAVGAAQYSGCAGCHGAAGAGGAGRALYQGEVLKTFPHIEDMLNFVYTGSQGYVKEGLATYGDPNREGGAHAPLSYNGNPMPMQGAMAGGGLTDAQILAVVCHERYALGGADPASEEYAAEYEDWCSPESPIFAALEAGSSTFDSIDKDFTALESKPGVVGTKARASIKK